jgi:two-component system, NtrC family, response regulator AtoC
LNIQQSKILIVDDDSSIRFALTEALRSWNYKSVAAANLREARRLFDDEEPSVVLLDIDLPDGSGLDFLTEIKGEQPDLIVVMITGNVDVKHTIAALRGGAHDFIGKPLRLEELRVTLRNALEVGELRREVKQTRRERAGKFGFEQIIGESAPLKKAIELAKKVAQSDVASILLHGETGTGKDLFARAIHHASERRAAPYLAINCAALPANLIESEIFGYEKGAFTDAKARKEGLFEQAQGGTIFLDEIGELDIGLQAKLLRVLEENTFRRVGGLKDLPLDVRVVAASNRDLKAEAEAQKFRLDLYFRLSVIRVDIPPLRERGDDILLLAKHYFERTNLKRGANKLKGLAPETAKIFLSYEWLGNVRELRNVIERASILEDGEFVTTEHLPVDLIGKNSTAAPLESSTFVLPAEGIPLEEVELQLAKQAMERTGGNLTHAAKLLHISRDQLRYRLKKSD